MNIFTLWESPQFEIAQASDCLLPGYLVVQGRQPAGKSLTRPQRAALQDALHRAKIVLRQLLGPQRVHVVRLGLVEGRLRYHVVPENLKVLLDELAIDGVPNDLAPGTVIERLAFVARARAFLKDGRSAVPLAHKPSPDNLEQGQTGHTAPG